MDYSVDAYWARWFAENVYKMTAKQCMYMKVYAWDFWEQKCSKLGESWPLCGKAFMGTLFVSEIGSFDGRILQLLFGHARLAICISNLHHQSE